MIFFSLFVLFFLVYLYLDKKEEENWVVLYEGRESSIGEAQELYWFLKGDKIPLNYEIPINWSNLIRMSYEECKVFIRVPREEVIEARRLLREFNAQRE